MANQLNSSGVTLDALAPASIETGATGKVLLYASGSGADTRLYVKAGSNTQTQLGIDIDQLTALGGATVAQGDHLLLSDAGTEKKLTFSNLEDTIFSNIDTASSHVGVAAGGAVTIQSGVVSNTMLAGSIADSKLNTISTADKVSLAALDIDGATALGGATVAQADLLVIDDGAGGTNKSVTFSNFEDSIFANISGDAAVAAGGALTIAANAVEGSMLNNNVISGQTDIGAALATTDEILVSDGGTLRRTDLSRLSTMLASTGLDDSSGQLAVDVSDFMANGSNNRIVTATGTDGMNAEANLTFDGSTLGVTGAISGSSTLTSVGTLRVGGAAQVSIGASAGVVSGSGTSTLHQLSADRIDVNVLDVNTINSNTITQNSLEIEDFNVLAGLSGSSSQLDGGGFKIGGHQASTLGSLVWNDSELGLRLVSGSTAVAKVNSSGLQVTSGAISGSGACTVLNVTTDKVTAAHLVTANLQVGAIKAVDGTSAGSIANSTGVVTLASSVLTTADINGGTIDGATIATSDVTVGSGKTLNVSAGTLTTSAAQNLAIMQGAAANVDIGGFDLRASTLTADSMTAGRVAIYGTNGVLSEDSDLTFSTDTLTVTKIGAFEAAGAIDFANQDMTNVDIDSGAIDGTIIGAASPAQLAATTGSLGMIAVSMGYGNNGISLDQGNINMDGNLKVGADGAGSDFAVYSDVVGYSMIWDPDASNHITNGEGILMVSGSLLVGKTSATSDYAIDVATGFGNVRADAFVTYSDRELKKDIAPIENSLDKIMKLEAVSYNMKHNNRHEIGFVAQEVAKVVPEICALDSKGIGRGIDYGRLTSLLAGAVQSQQGQIAELKAKIEKLQE